MSFCPVVLAKLQQLVSMIFVCREDLSRVDLLSWQSGRRDSKMKIDVSSHHKEIAILAELLNC